MSETIAEHVDVDPGRAVLIIQDLQNDVMIEGGAFAESGAPEHAKQQNVVENVRELAKACRAAGIPVIHVHYIVEDGAPGLKLNAGLFQGVKETGGLVRGSWGAAPHVPRTSAFASFTPSNSGAFSFRPGAPSSTT